MRGSINLIEPIGELTLFTGTPMRGAGWYGPTAGLHSVSIKVSNFTGQISVQASLAANPTAIDWFSVLPNNVLYWQYPRSVVTTNCFGGTGETSTTGFNFVCNAIWVRAIVDRTYLGYTSSIPQQVCSLGSVDSILLNY
jgi:hypothetical protein